MKLITKFFVITSLLVLSAVNSQVCVKVLGKKKEGDKEVSIEEDRKDESALYPSDLASDAAYAKAKENALKQTKAARNFFYNMKKEALDVLKALSTNLEKIIKKPGNAQKFIDFIKSGEQRQTSNTGTAQDPYLLLLKIQPGLTGDNVKLETISEIAQNVRNEKPSSKDIVAFLGVLGDAGACIQDVNNRGDQNANKKKILDVMNSSCDNLEAVSKDFYAKYSPDKYYNNSKQDKKKERRICSKSVKPNMDPRSGVLDTGAQADTDLKAKDTIPKIGWPLQTIPPKLTEFCKDEPWAGHFSGSFYEIVLLCQIFSADPANDKWDAKKEADPTKKEVCAALGAGFLVGLGMHSAIEVAVPLKNYLGGSIANINLDDAANKTALKAAICATGDNSSTDYVTKLLTKYTNAKKRKLK